MNKLNLQYIKYQPKLIFDNQNVLYTQLHVIIGKNYVHPEYMSGGYSYEFTCYDWKQIRFFIKSTNEYIGKITKVCR